MIDKNFLVLDLADGVQKLANISSFDVNTTIADADLMLIEQSGAINKVTVEDLKAEFGGLPTGTENNTVRFNSSGALIETDYLTINESYDGGNGIVTSFNLETENRHFVKQNISIGKDQNEISYNGNMELFNDNDNYTQFNMNGNSTENLVFSIENTKATLEDGDILVYNETNGTFKVDNISNYAGTGNYHVLVVDFLENTDYETTTIVPEGAIIDRLIIDSNGLTTGTNPLTFTIGGLSNIVLATQGTEFDNTANMFNILFFADGIILEVGTGEAGTFQSNWTGAGFGTGNGKAYLFYWTPLP